MWILQIIKIVIPGLVSVTIINVAVYHMLNTGQNVFYLKIVYYLNSVYIVI